MSPRSAAWASGPWARAAALAAAMAMVVSALEFVAHGAVRSRGPIYQGLDFIWAKPVATLVLTVPMALLLRRIAPWLCYWWLALLAILGPLVVLFPGSPIPLAILAAGLANIVRKPIEREPWQRRITRTGAVLAGVFAIAALVTQVQRALGARPTAEVPAAPGVPNVLLIIMDTVRGASMGTWGGRAATPAFDSVAATGTLFERAVSTAPWTLPTHASLFTGLWPHEHGADWRQPLGKAPRTLAEVMGAAGYRTGGFSSNLVFVSREHGLQRGFQVFEDYRRNAGAILRASMMFQVAANARIVRRITRYNDIIGRKYAGVASDEVLDWVSRDDSRPWFAFVNLFDAHEPFLPRAPYKGTYSEGLPPRRFDALRFWSVEGGLPDWSSIAPAEVEAERAAYEEAIWEQDAAIGALLAALRARGELENTLVIITSDHGEQFGEHGKYSHGNSLYWRAIHVPLVMSWPGHLTAGARSTTPVSLRDLGATIIGLALPGAHAFPGTPFIGPAARPAPGVVLVELTADPATSMRHETQQAIIGSSWEYIRTASGAEDAFVIAPDWSSRSIADSLLRAAVIDSGRARLATFSATRLSRVP